MVGDGAAGLLGVSNHWAWKVERAPSLAASLGIPGYEVLQYPHTYLRPRGDMTEPHSPDGKQGVVGGDLLGYLREDPGLVMVAYAPLLGGAYVRADKPLGPDYDHPGTPARLAALQRVATESGATFNQVVLAWLMGGEIPVIPLVGASSPAQLEEALSAVDLNLTADQRAELYAAQ